MKKLLIILTAILIISCKKDEGINQYVMDVQFEFGIKDSEGNDLLNPQNTNSYLESNIKIFYLINGKVTEVKDSMKDYAKNFLIYKHEKNYRIRIFLNVGKDEEITTTYIQWKDEDKDVIKSEIFRGKSIVRLQKVWLNDDPIWSSQDGKESYIELTK